LAEKISRLSSDAASSYDGIAEDAYSVSVVIPTYNRCLFQDSERNPLLWSISSIRQQSVDDLEIVIVDDASTDFTQMKMAQLSDLDVNLKLKYVRNERRMGSSKSRNIGAKLASNEVVLFLDDDCIFLSKNGVAVAAYSYKEMEKEGHDVGALHLSVYYRSNRFKDIFPVNDILGIDYENARIHCSTNSFPRERSHLEEDDYFIGTSLLRPLEVNNLAGVFLSKRKTFLNVGGFPESFPTPALGEEHKLAQMFTRNNYKLFFSPEPTSAVLHFKYGRVDKEPVMPTVSAINNAVDLPLSLEEMIDESRTLKKDTGNSVTVMEALHSYIYGRFMLFKDNELSKRKFIERVKDQIIEKNRYSYFNQKMDDRRLRESICTNAIRVAKKGSRAAHTISEKKENRLIRLRRVYME
jgi:glycosyltransferase involved in cell wall biosynthesis